MESAPGTTRCTALVSGWLVEGDIHVVAGGRLTDLLNTSGRTFIALTNAVVTDAATGEELARPSYLAINRANIELIFPV